MAQPVPVDFSSSAISCSPESPSRNVPVAPFGNVSENSRIDFGSAACSNGYCFPSLGEDGGGRDGSGIGAYVVVVVVVVVTLSQSQPACQLQGNLRNTPARVTHTVVFTDGASTIDGCCDRCDMAGKAGGRQGSHIRAGPTQRAVAAPTLRTLPHVFYSGAVFI